MKKTSSSSSSYRRVAICQINTWMHGQRRFDECGGSRTKTILPRPLSSLGSSLQNHGLSPHHIIWYPSWEPCTKYILRSIRISSKQAFYKGRGVAFFGRKLFPTAGASHPSKTTSPTIAIGFFFLVFQVFFVTDSRPGDCSSGLVIKLSVTWTFFSFFSFPFLKKGRFFR